MRAIEEEQGRSAGPAANRFTRWEAALLCLLLLGGLALRMRVVGLPLMEYHPTRQYFSALLARDMLGALRQDLRPELGPASGRKLLELPVLEVCVLPQALVTGRVSLTAGRVWATGFWLAGTVFFYLLVRRLQGRVAAMTCAAILGLWPFAVRASRVWLPEPVAFGWAGAAAFCLLRAGETGRRRWVWSSALCAVLALTVKPTVAFLLAPLAGAVLLERRSLPGRAAWAAFGMVLLAVAAWYGREALTGVMAGQIADKLNPRLWTKPVFYASVARMLGMTFGWTMLVGALVGVCVRGPGRPARLWLAGGAVGLAGLVFCFANKTVNHDYYYLVLLPWAAAGFGALVQAAWGAVLPGRLRWPVAAAVLALLAVHSVRATKVPADEAEGFRRTVRRMERAGEAAGHSERAILAGSAYTYPLRFHGRLAGATLHDASHRDALRRFRGESPPDQVAEFETLRRSIRAEVFVSAEPEPSFLSTDLFRHLEMHYRRVPAPEGVLVFALQVGDG